MKKILSVFMCFLLLFSFSISSVYALSVEEQAGEQLKGLGLYKGYEDGTLGLNKNITRAEFAALAVRIEGLDDKQEANKGTTPFKDVSGNHWASGYINIASSKELIKGFEDKTFKPEEQITYAQALAVVIRILGYEKDVTGTWPNNYINKAKDLGLDKNMNLSPNTPINRGQIAVIVSNALNVKIAVK